MRGAMWLVSAAFGVCVPGAAFAADAAVDLISPETIKVYGDVRAVGVDGEQPWHDGGFGKLRYGGDSAIALDSLRLKAELGEAGIVWQPRFGWAVGATVTAIAQGDGGHFQAGLSEAYLSVKPLGRGPVRFSARAGLMWPPISFEHEGPEWAVADTVTPSAIGSWIGEEVKVVGVEVTAKGAVGGGELSVTIAGFDCNDTAGALLAYRGWALHDRKALAFGTQPLPPLGDFMEYVQPGYSHPLLNVGAGLFSRPGYYAKLSWSASVPVRLEAFHYDNNGNPLAVNADLEWGWRTRFDTLGAVLRLASGLDLRAQGLSGRTRMGDHIGGVIWVDTKFRAAYASLTRRMTNGSVTARADFFGTRNRGSAVTGEDSEDGWAFTIAAKRELGRHFSAIAEFLHVESSRQARQRSALSPHQVQNQIQLVLRARL